MTFFANVFDVFARFPSFGEFFNEKDFGPVRTCLDSFGPAGTHTFGSVWTCSTKNSKILDFRIIVRRFHVHFSKKLFFTAEYSLVEYWDR